MKKLNLLFVVLSLVLITSQVEAKKVLLQYNLKQGTHFTVTHENNQDVAQEMMGQSQNTVMNMKMTYDFTVTGVEGSNMHLSCQLIYARMEMKSMMGDVVFDSEDTTNQSDVFKSFIPMLEASFTFSISSSGSVSDVVFPEDLQEKIKASSKMTDDVPMMGGMAGGFTSEEAMATTLSSLFLTYPTDKVAKGKAWNHESEMNQMIAFKTFTENTLVNTGKEVNELQQVGRFEQGDAPPMEMQGMTVQYDLSGGKEGHFILAATTGLIQTAELKSSISGVISVDSPDLPAPMTVPMTISGKETISIKMLSE